MGGKQNLCHFWQSPAKKATKVGRVSRTEIVTLVCKLYSSAKTSTGMSQAQDVHIRRDTDGKRVTSARCTITDGGMPQAQTVLMNTCHNGKLYNSVKTLMEEMSQKRKATRISWKAANGVHMKTDVARIPNQFTAPNPPRTRETDI